MSYFEQDIRRRHDLKSTYGYDTSGLRFTEFFIVPIFFTIIINYKKVVENVFLLPLLLTPLNFSSTLLLRVDCDRPPIKLKKRKILRCHGDFEVPVFSLQYHCYYYYCPL